MTIKKYTILMVFFGSTALISNSKIRIQDLAEDFKYVVSNIRNAEQFQFSRKEKYDKLMKPINEKLHNKLCREGQQIEINGNCRIHYSEMGYASDYVAYISCSDMSDSFLPIDTQYTDDYSGPRHFGIKFQAKGGPYTKDSAVTTDQQLDQLDKIQQLNKKYNGRWVLQGIIETRQGLTYKGGLSEGFVGNDGIFCYAKLIESKIVQNPAWEPSNY